MIKKTLLTGLAIAALSLTLSVNAFAAETNLTVGFGDSNTANSNWPEFGYDDSKKWMNVLGQTRPVINKGVGGNTTGAMLNRINDVIALKPTTTTVMAGTNDAVLSPGFIPKTSWRQFEINLNSIVNKLQAAGSNVVLMTTIPIIEEEYYKRHDINLYLKYGGARKFHDAYNDITRRVAAEQGVPLLDTYKVFLRFAGGETDYALCKSNLIDPTGTHMQPYGARTLHSNLIILLDKNGI